MIDKQSKTLYIKVENRVSKIMTESHYNYKEDYHDRKHKQSNFNSRT